MEKCYHFSFSVNILLSCLPSHLVWLRGGLRKKYWGAQRLDKGQWGGQRAGSCDAGLTADTELVVLPHPPTSTPGGNWLWPILVWHPTWCISAQQPCNGRNQIGVREYCWTPNKANKNKKDHIWYMVQWFNTPRQLWMYGGDIAVKCQSHDQVSVCLAWNALLPDKVEISNF